MRVATHFVLLAIFAGGITFLALNPASGQDTACKTTNFHTEMYRAACQKGGQKAAKDAAKAWNKEKKIKSCNQCHSKLAPAYERKPDALDQFRKLGGK